MRIHHLGMSPEEAKQSNHFFRKPDLNKQIGWGRVAEDTAELSVWLSLFGHGLGTCSECFWLLWQPMVGKEVSSLMVKSKKDQENWKPRLTLKGWSGKEPVGEAGMRQVWRGRDPASRGAGRETQSAGRGDVWPGRAAESLPDLAFT